MKSVPTSWLLAGAAAGGACGWYFGSAMNGVGFLGDMFLNALKALVIPLVLFSMISGLSSVGTLKGMGRLGAYTLAYYMGSMGLAVAQGLVWVNLIGPGVGGVPAEAAANLPAPAGWRDFLVALVPGNLVSAMAETQILPLILFALVFGAALLSVGKPAEPVLKVVEGLNEAVLRMVHWIMFLAPVGVFALVAARLGKSGGGAAFWAELSRLGLYVATVAWGLLVHALVVLPALVWFFTRRNPYRLLKQAGAALVTAFSTASSSATLPVTLDCIERQYQVSRRTSRFVVPLGATINMNGTALYEAVAALFIAQVYAIPLGLTGQLAVAFTATLAAIGAAGIPEAGLITMILVLQAAGLPVEGIGMLLAVDWFLDRLRTTVNVWDDCAGAAVLDRWVRRREEAA